jgi:hypothetical protein
MQIKEIWYCDSNLTSIVGHCHSLRLGVLELWIFFLLFGKPAECSWLPRFNELTLTTKSVDEGRSRGKATLAVGECLEKYEKALRGGGGQWAEVVEGK